MMYYLYEHNNTHEDMEKIPKTSCRKEYTRRYYIEHKKEIHKKNALVALVKKRKKEVILELRRKAHLGFHPEATDMCAYHVTRAPVTVSFD